MTLSRQDALKRLLAGEDPGLLLMAMRGPEEVAAEQHAAAMRWFDRPAFEVLREAIPQRSSALDFDAFVKQGTEQGVIEIAPGNDERYRIREGERGALLAGWRDSPEYRAFNAKLARYHHERHPEGSVDELQHLCASGADGHGAAQALFVRLFAGAEQRFDIARCAELIDVVDQPEYRLPNDFRAVIGQHRCYVKARTLWAEEFFRTAAYYNRAVLADALTALVSPRVERWILQVYAVGGMGKTMFLAWATSRFMAPRRIACARLNFDFEDPRQLVDQQWRFVLKLARQLNVQIVGAPFTELVKEYSELEREAADPESNPGPRDTRYNEEAFPRFTSNIAEAAAHASIVILCDTLEQVELHYPEALLALIRQLVDMHSVCPNVRLILAGRYNLEGEARIPAYQPAFGDVTRSMRIAPFTAEEGRAYLTENRGLRDDDRVKAIVERSDGVPFKLALFATIVQEDETLTAQAIRELEDVHVEYLIKRVVDRIEDPLLQWVVRHGVVPRRLTRPFLEDVMCPLLADIQAGRSNVDTGKDVALPKHLASATRFVTGVLSPEGPTIDAEALWQGLRRYAADYSWVWEPKDWKDTIVFHADVIDPMRRLLQEHEAFELLHDRAIEHYEARAGQDRENWVRWTREAIYHRFQKVGMAAQPAWRAAIEAALTRGDMRGIREIAEELLGAEYVEDDAPRLRRNGEPMVTWALRAEAAFAAAWAGVQEARLRNLPRDDMMYVTADRHLVEGERAQEKAGVQVMSALHVTLVRAASVLLRSPESALGLLDSVRANVTDDDRAAFEELEGDARATRQPEAAVAHYRRAIDHLVATASDESSNAARLAHLWIKFADATTRGSDHLGALHASWEALRIAERCGDAPLAGEARLRVVGELLTTGDATRAVAAARSRSKLALTDDLRAAIERLRIRATCDLGEPIRAQRFARKVFRESFATPPPTNTTERVANGYVSKAGLHEIFCEYGEAAEAWREARERWDVLGRRERVFRCTLRCATLLVRKERDLEAAGQLITDAEREASLLGASFVAEVKALECERLSYTRERNASRFALDRLLSPPSQALGYTPEAVAAVARQAFVMEYRQEEAAGWLASVLDRVAPGVTRLRLLRVRDRALSPSTSAIAILARVLDKAMEGIVKRPSPRIDDGSMATVAVLWWLGRHDDARKLLHSMARRLDKAPSLYALFDLCILVERLGMEPVNALYKRSLTRAFHKEFAGHDRLRARFMLTEAAASTAQDPRLDATIASIERQLGDPSWRTGEVRRLLSRLRRKVSEAKRLLSEADTPPTLESLVDPPSDDLLERRPAATDARPGKPPGTVPPAVPTWVIAIGRDGESVTVEREGRSPHERPLDAAFLALAGTSAAALTASGHATPGSDAALKFIASRSAGDRIRRLILDDDELAALRSRVDLRLELAHSVFGAIPWEWATTPDGVPLASHPSVRSMYRAAAARPPWPNRRSAGERAKKARTERSVLIVRRSRRVQYAEQRGIYSKGVDVADRYHDDGWRVNVLEDPSPAQVQELFRDDRYDVLHLNASAAETPSSGGLYLDVGRDAVRGGMESIKGVRQPRRSEGLSVRALASVLVSLSRDASPIVVLDPPDASGSTETTRQLLLRNAFASDLFQVGMTPAIVATGLAGYESDELPDILNRELVDGLAAGVSLREICATMRAHAFRAREQVARYPLATALFVHDADYVPPPHLAHRKKV